LFNVCKEDTYVNNGVEIDMRVGGHLPPHGNLAFFPASYLTASSLAPGTFATMITHDRALQVVRNLQDGRSRGLSRRTRIELEQLLKYVFSAQNARRMDVVCR
jgi:hypothetical protein